MTRPTWHLALGAAYRCAQCSGKLVVDFRSESMSVSAKCPGCGASREWDLPMGFHLSRRGDRIQFANVVPRFDYGQVGPPKPTGCVRELADSIEFVDDGEGDQ